MDKRLFKRWFNGMYGKLPPEKQFAELEKLKQCADILAEEKLVAFEKTHTCCQKCGRYSLKKEFVTRVKLITKKEKKASINTVRKAEFSVELYTCPKCGKEFVYDEKFVRFVD